MNETKHTCPHCKSKNTGKTDVLLLDVMKDYFCYDCGKDFYNEEQRKKYNSKN